MNSSLKNILKGGGLSFIIRITGVILMLCAHICLTRAMSMDDYGLFIYIFSIVPIASLICQSGFQVSSLRFLHEYNDDLPRRNGYIALSFLFPLCVSLTFFIIGQFIFSLLPDLSVSIKITIQYVSWICVFFTLSYIAQPQLRAYQKIFSSQFYEQIGLPLLLLLTALASLSFYQIKFELHIFLIVYGLFFVLLSIVMGILIIRHTKYSFRAQHIFQFSHWIKTSLSLGFSQLVIALVTRLDILILGWFLPAIFIAQYGVASRIAGLLIFFIAALSNIINPIIARLYQEKNFQEVSKIITLLHRSILLFNLLCIIALIFFGKYILQFFGHGYTDSYIILIILAIGQACNLSSGPLTTLFMLSKNQNVFLKICVYLLSLFFITLLVNTYLFGILGTAISTLVFSIFTSIILIIYVQKYTKISVI